MADKREYQWDLVTDGKKRFYALSSGEAELYLTKRGWVVEIRGRRTPVRATAKFKDAEEAVRFATLTALPADDVEQPKPKREVAVAAGAAVGIAALGSATGPANPSKAHRAIAGYRATRQLAGNLDDVILTRAEAMWASSVGKFAVKAERLYRPFRRRRTTARDNKAVIPALSDALEEIFHGMALSIHATLEGATREGVEGTAEMLAAVQVGRTPLDDKALIDALVARRMQEAEGLHRAAMFQIERRTRDRFAAVLTAAYRDRKVTDELVLDLIGSLDGQEWMFRRAVRTETTKALAAAQDDAIRVIATEPEFSGLRKRWTEHVDDLTGRPLDNRVGTDSIALHGQVAKPGALFSMPAAANVRRDFVNGKWYHPPNRPNDRAVLVPWMPGWGIPGWEYRAGRRVSI